MPDIEFSTKGAEKVVADQDRIGKSAQRNYQLTAKEAKDLGRVEQKILRDTETAQERYIRKLAEARKALAGNTKEVETLKRVEKLLADEFNRSASAAEKRSLKIKAAAGQATEAEKQLAGSIKETDGAMDGAFSVAKLTSVVGAVGAIRGAFALVTKELQAQQAMIDKRTEAQLSVGESRNQVLRNLVGSSPADIKKVQDAAIDISTQTGVSEAPINAALAAAISATGGNNDLAINLVRKATQFLKDRPTEIGDFAGSLGDLTRVTGSTDPSASLGLLTRIGQLSRITSPKLLAANAAPGLIGAAAFGGSPQSSGALFASLTTGSGDNTGATSGTAVVGLAQQLSEFASGEGAFKGKVAANPALQQGGLLDRIRYLQQNPAAAKQFLDTASFEKKMIGPIMQLLTDPSSAVRRDFEGGLRAIPGNAGLARVGNEALDIFTRNSLEPVADRKRTLAQGLEQAQARASSEYLSTEEIALVRARMMESGQTDFGAGLNELFNQATAGGKVRTSDVIAQLERRAQTLENPPGVDWGIALGGSPSGNDTLPATAEEREQAKLLREMVDALKKSSATQDKILGTLRSGDVSGLKVGGG